MSADTPDPKLVEVARAWLEENRGRPDHSMPRHLARLLTAQRPVAQELPGAGPGATPAMSTSSPADGSGEPGTISHTERARRWLVRECYYDGPEDEPNVAALAAEFAAVTDMVTAERLGADVAAVWRQLDLCQRALTTADAEVKAAEQRGYQRGKAEGARAYDDGWNAAHESLAATAPSVERAAYFRSRKRPT